MSLYQVQQCLFDYLRAKKHAPRDQKPDISRRGTTSPTPSERAGDARRGQALCDGRTSGDHQRLLPGHGLQAGRLPAAARRVAAEPNQEDPMADIVMAYSRLARADDDRRPGVGAAGAGRALLRRAGEGRERAQDTDAEAIVMMSGEHFTNFFLENLPQIAIGLGEGHQGPLEKWLKIPKTIVPGGRPDWPQHIMDRLVAPASSRRCRTR